ncbi:hypothetical protein TSUD_417930 [Trifolium subterraneum]|uniref:Aminotransferase-like plant mobile domain-containing protein n=1 Tax=Trifolium subterraneum TaxID=3900 RepID=A0A2Z6PJX1_TRISU|nr:hypothetical protein TSUD_417930 [Trifolium subterraneum]
MPVEQEQDIEQPVIVEQPMMQEDVAQHGWPGGPLDTSLLTRYADHVARYIWFGTERIEGLKPELSIASLGSKHTGWVPGPGQHHPNIQGWLDESGLKWLERTSLSRVDPQILSAFTERWHPEISSFHMSFGEMTITLDDVACLLHIPVRGIFYTPVAVSMEEATTLATELLGVPYEEAYLETSRQRGGTFTQQWIYDCWQRNLHMYHRYDCAARAYLLLLVGCTILTDKSYTRVNAKWLPMFRDLSTLNRFSWASVALVCLYDNLNDASIFTTHALAGYPTLLHCWIHEYFPTLGRRGEFVHRCDKMGYPRAKRFFFLFLPFQWCVQEGETVELDMPASDEEFLCLVGFTSISLPLVDVESSYTVVIRWVTLELCGHRGSIPSDLITCFSGYLRGCTVVPYLPERCLRQFGFVQYIPPPPP